ncbi:DUF3237 domain-containing protein [Paeniglutamicibacter cryotolerans]|uniref:UPF0311 protein E9229_001382 n=1 Tax=Paeniglutamicibacter cryotolerans TaxID=670079 RepID=A0A839QT21_9MICC|nr:DUF3237 domain-containing protein [Paeniglutamicibacter cryotolerans]MBB2995191.1 hypothetical protein [Paeniglutamicibacter cryotolerans]
MDTPSTAQISAHGSANPPRLVFLASLSIEVATPIEVGPTLEGTRRVIPIQGGTVSGPRLNGRILPGGADFQLLTSDTLTELEAKYVIETTSGERIYVANFGLRTGTPEDIAALVRGEEVPPERIYFRCTPRLLSAGEEWGWLASRIILGVGTRLPTEVRLELWIVE